MTITSLDYFTLPVRQASDVPLFEAALAIAQDAYPKLGFDAPQNELDRLAHTLRQCLSSNASVIQKLRLLNHFFYQELGFAINVNNYYDADNSYLQRVIAKRRGIPISLALVYMKLAQQIGVAVKGVSFPGHFLMWLTTSGDIMIGPANSASLSREQLEERHEPYLPSSNNAKRISRVTYLQIAHPHDILVRVLRNLKTIFLQNRKWQRFLGVQQRLLILRLLILRPGNAEERRDRGQTYAQLDYPQAADAE